MTLEGPNRPEPQSLTLGNKTTSIVVLDLSRRCENPQEVCSNLMTPLAEFLERARQASVPILYTISAAGKGHHLVKSPRRSSDENQSQSFIQTPSTNLSMARLRRNWINGIVAHSLSSARRRISPCSTPRRRRRGSFVTMW